MATVRHMGRMIGEAPLAMPEKVWKRQPDGSIELVPFDSLDKTQQETVRELQAKKEAKKRQNDASAQPISTKPFNLDENGNPVMPIISDDTPSEPQVDYIAMFEKQQKAYESQIRQMQLANRNQMRQMQNMFETSMSQLTNQMSALRNPITPETKRPSIILGDSRSIRSMALR